MRPVSSALASAQHGESSDEAVSLGEPLLDVAQAALLLNVRESWVRDAARARHLPCVHVGRHLRFSRQQLERWLGEQTTTAVHAASAANADDLRGRQRR